MSSKVIQSFYKNYKVIATRKDITKLPYPKEPINTDKLIVEYQNILNTYMNNRGQSVDAGKYKFELKELEFPSKYFNYGPR
jgi:hypothetical protein